MTAAWAGCFHHVAYIAGKPHHQCQCRRHGNDRNHALGKPTGQSDSDELPGRAEPDTKQAGKTASGVCFRDLFIEDFDHLGAKLAAKLVGIEDKRRRVNLAADFEDGRDGVAVNDRHGAPTSCAGRSGPATPYDSTRLRIPDYRSVTADNSGGGARSLRRSRFLQSARVPASAGWWCRASPVPS